MMKRNKKETRTTDRGRGGCRQCITAAKRREQLFKGRKIRSTRRDAIFFSVFDKGPSSERQENNLEHQSTSLSQHERKRGGGHNYGVLRRNNLSFITSFSFVSRIFRACTTSLFLLTQGKERLIYCRSRKTYPV